MDSKQRKRIKEIRRYTICVRLVLGIVAVIAFLGLSEHRTKALIVEATGELVPIYFKDSEVVYGEEIVALADISEFTYEKAMDPFVSVDCSLSEELQEYTWLMCKANNLDFPLVMALMKHESRYDETAVSKTDDYGLMQINELNHEWLSGELGITDYLDAKQNINAGVYVLRLLFEKYEDSGKVLMAYNMGESNAKKYWRNGIYESDYSRQVLKYQAEIKEQLETVD